MGYLRLWKDGVRLAEAVVTIDVAPPPTTRVGLLGSSTPPQSRHGNTSKEQEARWLEDKFGHKLGATRHYVKAPNAWTGDGASESVASGRVPVISFTSGGDSWAQVAAGSLDAYVTAQVKALNQRGGGWLKAIIGFENEPEAESPGKGTPAQYAAAANHLIQVARAAGYKGIWTTFFMEFSWQNGSGRNPDAWIPDKIDWLGVHGYSTRVGSCGGSIRSFVDTFDAPHATAVKFNKRMGIFEAGYATCATGCLPKAKGDFFRSIPKALAAGQLPRTDAYVYWNMSGGACDLPYAYFLDSAGVTGDPMKGFADALAAPFFNGGVASARRLEAAEVGERGGEWEPSDDTCPRCGSLMRQMAYIWRCANCEVKGRPAVVSDTERRDWRRSLA